MTKTVTKTMTDLLGRERYRIDRTLGVGAMGTVYLARDTILDRVVAIKVLADHLAADDAFRERFLREARLAARLCHPNIVQVFDAGEDEGRPFLVMEHVDGDTLADRQAGERRCTPAELVSLTAELAAGLAHAHAAGIVHRDVKPHNVLLRADGVAKLTDFGIARAVTESGLTEIGTVLGTAAYMAPEQAAGQEVGPAADVYALGGLVRHLAAGPLPPALEALVDGALAPDPAARPSAEEMHLRLAALAEETAVSPGPPPADPTGPMVVSGAAEVAPTEVRSSHPTELMPPSEPRWTPEPWWRVAAAIVVAVLLAGFLSLTRDSGGSGETTPTTTASVPAVPTAPDPAQAARNLAEWLRGQAE